MEWYQVWEVVVVASRTDLAALPNRLIPGSSTRRMLRLPGESILDVVTDNIVLSSPYPDCSQAVNARFDLQSAHVITDTDTRSLQRKVVATLADGRKVLLRTKTSARDFEAAAPTPFVIR